MSKRGLLRTPAKLLTLGILGGRASITYLFRDEFTTDAAAPLATPRTAEPGPGTLTLVQTDGQFSISGGELVFPAQTTSAWGDQGFYGDALTSAAGRALFSEVTLTTVKAIYLCSLGGTANVSNASDGPGIYMNSGSVLSLRVITSPEIVAPVNLSVATKYKLAVVLQSAGALYFVQGGAFTSWTLVFLHAVATAATLYPRIANYSAAGSVNRFAVRDLPAPFTTDHGIATLDVAGPADQTEYTGDADGIIDLTVTAPGVLDGSATTRCGFYYRADADLSPAWHCYVDGLGAFNVDSIDAAGTRTNRITAASVIAGGATVTLRVICAGSLHDAYSLNSTTWTKRGSQVNVSLNDTGTTIEPSIPAGWSAANLRSYPRTSAAYAELDRE